MSTEAIDPKFANYRQPAALQKRLNTMSVIDGVASNRTAAVAIVVGRWHGYIVDRLLIGALDTLNELGIGDSSIDIVNAPGAYEMPLLVKLLAEKEKYQAVITLGAVIKGETPHFDFVAGECARGLADVSRQHNLPVGFGVLTVNTVEQALARAEEGDANKGREAVLAALEVAGLIECLK
jgi:6,7-dimethyl-8-ribityllumazine synthase